MRFEASALRVADRVRQPGAGEREVRRVEFRGRDVCVWFRGEGEQDGAPGAVFDATEVIEIQRPIAPPLRLVPDARAGADATSEPTKRGRGRPADRESQAERLRVIARRIIADGDAWPRARQAAALRIAADEVAAGRLLYLARVTSRPQIEDLEAALVVARAQRWRQLAGRDEEGGEPEIEDLPFAGLHALQVEARDRLARLGIHDSASLREALREWLGCRPDAGARDQALSGS